MAFAKLDAGIVDSTLWMQPHDTLRVWIAMLAKADQAGIVRASVPSMAHLCMIDIERMREILAVLEAPDQDSRTEAEEGRRLRRIEGGWEIVNYLKYRNTRDGDLRREQQRQWDREHRGARPNSKARKHLSDSKPPTTPDNPRQPPTHAEAEADTEAEAEKAKSKDFALSPAGSPPSFVITFTLNDKSEFGITNEHLATFRESYPGIDVVAELRKIRAWCMSKPQKRKTRRGALAFVNSWLSSAQDKCGGRSNGADYSSRQADGPSPAATRRLGS